jgi:hypothetical protein
MSAATCPTCAEAARLSTAFDRLLRDLTAIQGLANVKGDGLVRASREDLAGRLERIHALAGAEKGGEHVGS